jgi:tRNA modification GTPase
MKNNETIAALATAPAPAGIAVIRISGPKTKAVLRALFRAAEDPVKNERKLILGQLIDHKSQAVIDRALAVFFKGPGSFTGEDVAEFQFHGSNLLVKKILRSLFSFGVAPASPGEFTQRAFLNGKMDLVQAEAVCDLINATSESALRIAVEHLEGRFSKTLIEVGEPLRDALAEIEAAIDFPEEDIDPATSQQVLQQISKTCSELDRLLGTYEYGAKVKEGFKVLLCGRPNVGKSSLLNLLLGKNRAIVTDVSGTTRDLIEEEAVIEGYKFIFCDSAGLTETQDRVEKIGVELARERLPWADLVLLVIDPTSHNQKNLEALLSEVRGKASRLWMVINKIDLNPSAIGSIFCDSKTCAQNFYLSAKTLDGFGSLKEALIQEIKSSIGSASEASGIVTNERQRNCLVESSQLLQSAISAIKEQQPLEIVSLEIRSALNSLEEIIGTTYTEDLLGRIFSKFCIGK